MANLTPDIIPTSFTGQALFWGAKNDFLNPINEGQGDFSRFIGKPMRFVARLIYMVA